MNQRKKMRNKSIWEVYVHGFHFCHNEILDDALQGERIPAEPQNRFLIFFSIIMIKMTSHSVFTGNPLLDHWIMLEES